MSARTEAAKPRFDEDCLVFLDQRKQAKMQWVQDSSQSNVDNLNNVRHVTSRHFTKKEAYLKAKIEELETNSKIKNIRDLYRGINEFKKDYQPRTNTVIDDKGDLDADSHSILARWRNYFSQILNIHGVNDIMQTEIHTAEPLVHEPSASEYELDPENVKSHKSPGTKQITAELIKAGNSTIHREIHKLISISCLRSGISRSEYLSMRKGDKTDCSNYRGKSLLHTTYKILSKIVLSRLTPHE